MGIIFSCGDYFFLTRSRSWPTCVDGYIERDGACYVEVGPCTSADKFCDHDGIVTGTVDVTDNNCGCNCEGTGYSGESCSVALQ